MAALRDFINNQETVGARRNEDGIAFLQFHQPRGQRAFRHFDVIDFQRFGAGGIHQRIRPSDDFAVYLQPDARKLAGLIRFDIGVDMQRIKLFAPVVVLDYPAFIPSCHFCSFC